MEKKIPVYRVKVLFIFSITEHHLWGHVCPTVLFVFGDPHVLGYFKFFGKFLGKLM